MRISDSIQIAWDSLRGQPLKASFMGLGVTIGVAFLLIIVGIVEGLGGYVENDLIGKLLIPNSIVVRTQLPQNRRPPSEEEKRAYARRTAMTTEEVKKLVEDLPRGAKWATENFTISPVRVPGEDTRKSSWVYIVSGQTQQMKSYEVSAGRLLSDIEIETGAPVVLIGADLAESLFPGRSAINRSVRLGNDTYEVVGVAAKQGSILGLSLDNFTLVSQASPASRLTGKPKEIQSLTVQMLSQDGLQDASDQVRTTFRQLRHQLPSEPDDFDISLNNDALVFVSKIKGYLTYAAIGLPAISILVGGIIILNIMLMVVLERTREVGVRKALGATQGNIVSQFLIEATLISLVGSTAGIIIGISGLFFIREASPLTTAAAPWWAFVLSIGVGAGTGIGAGVIPAIRAAKLQPVAALRQE